MILRPGGFGVRNTGFAVRGAAGQDCGCCGTGRTERCLACGSTPGTPAMRLVFSGITFQTGCCNLCYQPFGIFFSLDTTDIDPNILVSLPAGGGSTCQWGPINTPCGTYVNGEGSCDCRGQALTGNLTVQLSSTGSDTSRTFTVRAWMPGLYSAFDQPLFLGSRSFSCLRTGTITNGVAVAPIRVDRGDGTLVTCGSQGGGSVTLEAL